MSKIGHAASDERGKYAGGEAGDQTGKEVCTREWYNRPWNVVLWAKDSTIREKMAVAMEQACANDNIGYDQGTQGNSNDRYSLYNAAKAVSFNLSKVSTKCETDCSNLVAVCANAAGIPISPYIYTGNEKEAFRKTGLFEIHTESKYLTSPDYLPRGAVLIYEGHHTAINLENGAKWEMTENVSEENIPIFNVSGNLTVVGAVALNVRQNPSIKSSIITYLSKGDIVDITKRSSKINGTYWFKCSLGWISGKYVEGLIKEPDFSNRSWIIHEGQTYNKNTLELFNGKTYCLNQDGYIITPDYLNEDGSLK